MSLSVDEHTRCAGLEQVVAHSKTHKSLNELGYFGHGIIIRIMIYGIKVDDTVLFGVTFTRQLR